jgi:spermidine synthase
LSGAAGLGYQIAWTRMFAVGLGHEMPALLAVVAAVMGGMALGAWRLGSGRRRRGDPTGGGDPANSDGRRRSGDPTGGGDVTNPGGFYALLESIIGIWAAITPFLIPAANRLAISWIGVDPSPVRHWLVAFVVPFFALLPATAAMGATLPAIERFVTPRTLRGQSVGALYAANTLGAVTGVLGSAFIALPRLGLRNTVFLLAAGNLLSSAIAFALGGRSVVGNPINSDGRRRSGDPTSATGERRLWVTLFFTGLLGIGYEVVGVRVLAQVLENTVYTYAAVLAVFLLGTALGAAIYHRLARSPQTADLILITALAGGAGILAATQANSLYQFCRTRGGDSIPGVLMAEMIVAASVFLLSTMAMGATFTHLVQTARDIHGGIGGAVAINTLGAAVAPLLFLVWLLPWLGSKWTLLIIAIGYVAMLPRFGKRHWVLVPILSLAFLPGARLHYVALRGDDRLVDFREGLMASVAVVEDAMSYKTLRVDNRFQMGGTGVAEAEYRHAHIPLLLHPKPQRVLFLGVGTGITLSTAALHTNVIAEGVELLPEVVAVLPDFSPFNDAVRTNPNLRVHVADARRFVQVATNRYDVIVGDLFHPARDGAGSLYTLEHFRSIRARLAPGGLFCQWLPMHQIDPRTFAVITRTFLDVFPQAQAWWLRFNVDTPVIGLIGSIAPVSYSTDWIEKRSEAAPLFDRLRKLALNDSLRLFGNLLAGPQELQALVARASLNTDDNSAILFGAPRFSYAHNVFPYGGLLPLLELPITNGMAVLGFHSPSLDRFWVARNAFLKGLMAESEGAMETACERYIESARLSEEFTAGYARILTIATAEAKSNPQTSRSLLERLAEAQPERPVARQLLHRLFPEPPR